ncbi:MAG: 1,4-dihydroxy-6-naphthoate synthase [Desulfobacterales bacterium C00003106]|jgi:1,4-dihydroxy-6-naphthoate synthase|nr:MAG: 1,4-dihydroxy-6-naphthoate synthase [Desulfobacterales bacterium C00003106]
MSLFEQNISLGISPCPNDTFIFHALLHGLIDGNRFRFLLRMEDVDTLNRMGMDAALDLTKISFHMFGYLRNEYVLLNSGAALGRGCGPLLIAYPGLSLEKIKDKTIAVPGRFTTANLLLQLMTGGHDNIREMRFDRIVEAVATREVAAGLIIHETRFTYQLRRLVALVDLGGWWEDRTSRPIPLGGIIARRSLGEATIRSLDEMIKRSVIHARRDPEASRNFVRGHAQELSDEVIRKHIDLYVNDFSVDLGGEGRKAVKTLFDQAEQSRIIPESSRTLMI